jgi:uncharacterized protein (DUF169 family)
MPTWNDLEQTLTRHLKLDRSPVAVTFCDAVPAGVRKFEGSVPSGCTFWKVAATAPPRQGAFYTVAADHQRRRRFRGRHERRLRWCTRGSGRRPLRLTW